nr:MAG TPA: resistance protein [Caudoviricetes sp.]
MKLYELTQNYLNLQELLENPEIPAEMIETALNEVGGQIEDKAENIAKLIKTLEADVSGFKAEEKRLADRRKSLENRVTGLKNYIDNSMKVTGKNKFKGQLFSFSIQKNPPSLNVEDEKLIPEEYWIEQAPVLDKKTLLAALKSGEEIPGVSIKQTESLRIR